ncbi:hypothetical protein [Flammeovirga kamogawensis]|uniref:Uncharacterized protein n=1 Tax=Flammeovirga kamogawensis TaxID=373891 RepID=A0ABX8GVD1_9BACT|nr:hypothetical protein [Flammeovirga kamogawensis]MBB6459654.1 hypothetical protein [Flammeovirga kamogawensis]QWG07283.1 hypothetical protein KM029_18565 [Flammeovirga kamogawensis]TRX69102.1 hypothetical protein EO216_13555 [Flammeovirga kamogawensis]
MLLFVVLGICSQIKGYAQVENSNSNTLIIDKTTLCFDRNKLVFFSSDLIKKNDALDTEFFSTEEDKI